MTFADVNVLQRRGVDDDVGLDPAHPGFKAARIADVAKNIRCRQTRRGALYRLDDIDQAVIVLIQHGEVGAAKFRELQAQSGANAACGAGDENALVGEERRYR